MKGKRKLVLRRNITLIMFAFIGTIVIVYLIGVYILKNYENQVKKIADQTIGFYGNEMDEELENINRQLVNTLINNISIKKISSLDLIQNSNKVVTSIAQQNELAAYFDTLYINYKKGYHFWFFNKEQDVFVASGEGNYASKEGFKKEIRTLASESNIPITEKRKWFLMEIEQELFLVTAFHLNGNYIGCWIKPESQLSSLWTLEDGSDSAIILQDMTTGKEYNAVKEAEHRKFITSAKVTYKDSYICKYSFEHANVDMKMAVYQTLQRKASLFQAIMVVTAILIIFLCIGTLYYSRHSITLPLEIFAYNLKKYRETGEFEHNDDYEEFKEVGNVLKKLEQEIQNLKVSIYEENLEKQKAQIDYMQLQIHPHFYINCLNSIFSMAQMGHTEEIQELVQYVTSYMRSIFRKGMNPIKLKEELENINHYIRIHKILYRYSCTYQLDVNEEILMAEIPPLIVMIFVENSVKYTSGMKKDVLIHIQADYEKEDKEKIFIEISDSGSGFSTSLLENEQEKRSKMKDDRFQIGIGNARNRLQMLYGSRAELIMNNGDNGGAKVKIIIPFKCVKE